MTGHPIRARGVVARRRTAVAVALLLVAALSGCVSIPTAGDIISVPGDLPEPGIGIPLPAGPEPDATPERIVDGFLRAGEAGVYSDNFEKALEFLTPATGQTWQPRGGTVVYSGDPQVLAGSIDTVVVEVPEVATVDGAGRYTESASQATARQMHFTLQQDANSQWRISELEDGVLMSLPSFLDSHRQVRIYFATRDQGELLPELRWFPAQNLVVSTATALFNGASPWLRDGVTTGIPAGTRLSPAGITLSAGILTLELSSGVDRTADRELMQAQLEATFGRFRDPVVTAVVVTAGGLPWTPNGVPALDRDVSPETGPFVISGDQLAVVEGRDTVVPLDGAASLAGLAANSPAVSLDGKTRVVLDGSARLYQLPPDGGPPLVLVEGTSLVAPSIDRHGWVWTGERTSSGALLSVAPGGAPVEVAADWLQGRELRSMRVSRDGTRVAIVSVGPDMRADVQVASVVRDPQTGQPQRLSEERLTVGASLDDVTEVTWVDEITLAALGTSGVGDPPTVYRVPLGGPSEALPTPDGVTGLAAAKDRLYILAEGELLQRAGTGWTSVAAEVRDPVFPG